MSEVSKAAERLSKNGYSSTIELDAAGPTGFVIVNGSTWDDVTDLADWALPLLDSEPITEDWLEAVGFKRSDEGTMLRVAAASPNKHLRYTAVSFDVVSGNWFANGLGCQEQKTRGAVRMLCLSLGIPLKQPAERA